jgi:hypothetical protein
VFPWVLAETKTLKVIFFPPRLLSFSIDTEKWSRDVIIAGYQSSYKHIAIFFSDLLFK